MAKIIGTPTVTPVPKTDFLQTDPTKADYLKGREHIATKEDLEIAAPKKGVDYYTAAEKAELVEEISRTVTGDIETALDGIITVQEELIGGADV